MNMNAISFVRVASIVMCLASVVGCYQIKSCVEVGTQIATPLGLMKVESLKPGDQVWSYTPRNTLEVSTVVDTRASSAREVYEIKTTDGQVLSATSSHPVFSNDSWKEAARLTIGSTVAVKGGVSEILDINRVKRTTTVYDISVVPYANYFANGVLVHNKTVIPRTTVEEVSRTWIGYNHGLYVLELNSDGTGQAARLMMSKNAQIQEIQVDNWTLEGDSVQILLTEPSIHGGLRTFKFAGKAYEHILMLWRVNTHGQPGDLIRFHPADVVFEKVDSLKEFMDHRTDLPDE